MSQQIRSGCRHIARRAQTGLKRMPCGKNCSHRRVESVVGHVVCFLKARGRGIVLAVGARGLLGALSPVLPMAGQPALISPMQWGLFSPFVDDLLTDLCGVGGAWIRYSSWVPGTSGSALALRPLWEHVIVSPRVRTGLSSCAPHTRARPIGSEIRTDARACQMCGFCGTGTTKCSVLSHDNGAPRQWRR